MSMNRRSFLKKSAFLGLASSIGGTVLNSTLQAAEGGAKTTVLLTKGATPQPPLAVTLKYVANTKDAVGKTEKKNKTKSIASDKQNCGNCSFYKKVDGQKHGSCQLFQPTATHIFLVPEEGYCNSYAPA